MEDECPDCGQLHEPAAPCVPVERELPDNEE